MTVLWVALGGALGALVRHAAREVATRAGRPEGGTLAVNVAGAAALGLVVAADLPGWADALIGTGALGSLTTMSTFALDAATLAARPGGRAAAARYVGITLVLGLAAATTVAV